jgi:RNA polymerase sigma-70 factor (ECF subfamily)
MPAVANGAEIRVLQTVPSVPFVAAPNNSADERALVQRARAGDSEAISELYHLHSKAIFRYFLFRVKDRCTAEDLTGEVFLQIVEALPRYVDRGRPFAAWIFRIARYRVIDFYRRTRTARAASMSEELPDAIQDGSESIAMRQLETRRLHAQIGELTDEQKTVVQMRFFEGYSLEDTAAIMGKSAAAIKALQHRALQQLARRLHPAA